MYGRPMNNLMNASQFVTAPRNVAAARRILHAMMCAQTIRLMTDELHDLADESLAAESENNHSHDSAMAQTACCSDGGEPCICGRAKRRGRLCSNCLASAPDFIREQFLGGSPAQRQNAARWLSARAVRSFEATERRLAA